MGQDRYREAGVDIDAGAELVSRIGRAVSSTHRPEVLGGLGGFGGLWSVGRSGYRDLVLVSGADGVGTKLDVAQRAGRHDTIGIDLVAMCANDVLCAGAEPFFFLDYFATGKLEVGVAEQVVEGIAEGCRRAGCSLIGGETAEMPGMYSPGTYDLAGFCVGGVERDEVLDGSRVEVGQHLLGLRSSGLHSNGFSLVRQVVFGDLGMDLDQEVDGVGVLADALLTPTRMYVEAVLPEIRAGRVAGVAHITGGGLPENVPRALPKGTAALLRRQAWELPPLFAWLRDVGALSQRDLLRTFNCGIGLVLAVSPEAVASTTAALTSAGESVIALGEVVPHDGEPEVQWA